MASRQMGKTTRMLDEAKRRHEDHERVEVWSATVTKADQLHSKQIKSHGLPRSVFYPQPERTK